MTPISINDPPVQVLRTIQGYYPSAIIAGGAPRDLFLELPIKDFDIFIQENDMATRADWWCALFNLEEIEYDGWADIQALAFFGQDNVLMKTSEDQPPDVSYFTKQHLRTVFDLVINHVIYQIVVVTLDPKLYVEDWFDFGICKTWCDGKQFHFSGPFMHDVQHRQLTVVQKSMTKKEMKFCLEVRKPRLLSKLPGYSFKVAPHLTKLYNEVRKQLK